MLFYSSFRFYVVKMIYANGGVGPDSGYGDFASDFARLIPYPSISIYSSFIVTRFDQGRYSLSQFVTNRTQELYKHTVHSFELLKFN